MAKLEIRQKGTTTKHTQSGTSNYQYTTNNNNISDHLYRIDGGSDTWGTNPSSWHGSLEELGIGLEGDNTDLAVFEGSWDGWNSTGEGSTGGAAWIINSGSTPTGSTGPTHAVSGSQYIFTEVDGYTSETFSLTKAITPPSVSNNKKLENISFYYFMYGSGMGALYVEVKIGASWQTLWSRSGQQHAFEGAKTFQLSPYEQVSLYLTTYDGVIHSPAIDIDAITAVRFRYVATSSTIGDCAIDSIALGYNPYVTQPAA